MKDRVNRTLFELVCGILTYGILTQVILAVISIIVSNNVGNPDEIYKIGPLSLGLWIGIIAACLSAYHMWWAMDRFLELPEGDATKKITLHYMIRYVAMALVLFAICITKIGNPLTAFAGLMGIKFGAYLNGLMKLISNKIYGIEPPYTESEETTGGELEK